MTVKRPSFNLQAKDEGIHLEDTILWFDSPSCRDMSFLSSATPPLPREQPGHKTRWIAIDDTIALAKMMGRDYNALRCQYHRPFSVGSLRLEMLPSGGGLGTSSLYVEHQGRSLLYAPTLQPNKSPISRQLELRPAETLIVCAHEPIKTSPQPREKVLLDILAIVEQEIEQGQWPTIFCAQSPMAQNLTRFLTDHNVPVTVPSTIAKIHKLYTNCGVALGPYSTIPRKRQKQKSKVHLQALKLPRAHAHDPALIRLQKQNGDTLDFRYPLWATLTELQAIIDEINPKQTLVTGPYARSYANSLKTTQKISPLFQNNEPTLF